MSSEGGNLSSDELFNFAGSSGEDSGYVDFETVKDIVDEVELIEGFEEIGHARSDVEEAMHFAYHKYPSGRVVVLVGHIKVTNDFCGVWGKLKGCARVELHRHAKVMDVFGNVVDHSGEVFMKNGVHSCDRWGCPKCYRRAAFRAAVRAEERLVELGKYNPIEHVIFSVPLSLYEFEEDKLRVMFRKIALKVGVLGGAVVFHAFRYDGERRMWYYSPHFHVCSSILGGYKCRSCEKGDYASRSVCAGCDGFENRVRVLNGDGKGWIVKVARDCVTGKAEKRRSIRKTLAYEMSHASIPLDGEHISVVSYFGVASFRKLKVDHKRLKELCPLCGHELVEFRYAGNDVMVLARINWGVGGSFYDSLLDGKGSPNYIEVEHDRFGRSIYVL